MSVVSRTKDQDGDLDLFVSDPQQPTRVEILYFERVNGSALVQARSPLAGFDATHVKNLVVADFDADGAMDATQPRSQHRTPFAVVLHLYRGVAFGGLYVH